MANSLSYDYGFNNKVGLILICICMFVWAFLGFKSETKGIKYIYNPGVIPPTPKVFKVLNILVLLYSVWMFLLIVCVGNNIGEIGESGYFLRYYYLLDLGKQGYVDFAFGYGPLILYPPYLIHKYIGVSIPIGYTITLYSYHVIGLFCLYDVLKRYRLSEKEMIWFLLAVFFSMFLEAAGGGIHYQLSRFILPSWLLLRILGIFNRTKEGNLPYRFFRVFVMPMAMFLVLLMSPEIGIAFGLVCVIIQSILSYVRKELDYLMSIVLTLMVIYLTYLLCPGLFSYIRAFSGGYNNFPFTINVLLLLFIICLFFVAYNLGALFREFNDNIENVAFVLISLSLLPACFGRCDPGHLLWNGLFVFPLAYVGLKEYISTKYSNMLIVFIFVLYQLPSPYLIKPYGIRLTLGVLKNNIEFFTENRKYFPPFFNSVIGRVSNHLIKEERFLTELSHITRIALPFSTDYELNLKVIKEGKMADLYFIGIFNKMGIDSIIKDLDVKEVPYLLLPEGWQIHPSNLEKNASYQSIVKNDLLAWYPFEVRFDGYNAFDPLILFVKTNYYYERDVVYMNRYELWRRK